MRSHCGVPINWSFFGMQSIVHTHKQDDISSFVCFFQSFYFSMEGLKIQDFFNSPFTSITTLQAGSLMGPHFKVRISMGEHSFPIGRIGIVVFMAFPSMAHPAQTGQSSFFVQWPLPCHLSSITYSDKDILLQVGLGQISGQGKGNLEPQFSTIFSGSHLEA